MELTVFKDDESWNKVLMSLKKAPSYENYKGKLHNYESFLIIINLMRNLQKCYLGCYAYASLSSDLNLKIKKKWIKQQLSLVLANMSD